MTTEEHRARNVLYQGLLQNPHRDYSQIVPQWREALRDDPDFFARVCVHVYNTSKIRDQVDVATITMLQAPNTYPDYRESGRCMLLGNRVYSDTNVPVAGLPPFRIFRVWDYIRKSDVKVPRLLKSTMTDYSRALEANPAWMDAVILRNRKVIKAVYKYHHIAPSARAQAILFDDNPPDDSKLAVLKQIANSDSPREQARLIIEHRIPYVVAASAMPKMNAASAIALVEVMTPQEALNSVSWVTQSGILEIVEVREAFEAKVANATASVATAEHRVSAQTTDEGVQAAISAAKEKAVREESNRIQKSTLLLIDRSGSMSIAIRVAQQFGSRIAPLCDAELMVVAFNDYAQEIKVEGNTLADWQRAFRGIRPGGATSMTAGYLLAKREGFKPEQVILITDGGENRDDYAGEMRRDADAPHTIVLRVPGDGDVLTHRLNQTGVRFDRFETDGSDYYVFDQVVALMGGPPAVSLVQQVMETVLPRRL